MTDRLTISDVGRAAGVSRQTVSRVLNHKDELSPDTRDRVLCVIGEPDYRAKVALLASPTPTSTARRACRRTLAPSRSAMSPTASILSWKMGAT